MEIFKEIIGIINRTLATYGFGFGLAQLLNGEYKIAAWALFIVSILFMVGFFTERWSRIYNGV